MTGGQSFLRGYRAHFPALAECAADRALQALDTRFQPRVFLVGFRTAERDDRFPVCVVPEDCPCPPEAFDALRGTLAKLQAQGPERQGRPARPIAPANSRRAPAPHALRR